VDKGCDTANFLDQIVRRMEHTRWFLRSHNTRPLAHIRDVILLDPARWS
jgi:hypothetical protein